MLSLSSAFFLGVYDLCKKRSVHDNAVPPVLLISCSVGAMIWLPLVLLSRWGIFARETSWCYVSALSAREHLYLFAKSALVGASWTFAFFGLKRLPITIAVPIRATSPLWTIAIACAVMGERPRVLQWLGVAVILASFFAFSFVGKLDGIRFYRDRGVAYMMVATLLAAGSALYDKYLLQNLEFDTPTVQAWFSIYLVPVMVPFGSYWYWRQRDKSPFVWRWSIPLIAVFLLVADFLYFQAIRSEDALISLISPVRRTSLVVAFAGGALMFGERNLQPKAFCAAAMLVGVWLLSG